MSHYSKKINSSSYAAVLGHVSSVNNEDSLQDDTDYLLSGDDEDTLSFLDSEEFTEAAPLEQGALKFTSIEEQA